jgi:hypothetical protein
MINIAGYLQPQLSLSADIIQAVAHRFGGCDEAKRPAISLQTPRHAAYLNINESGDAYGYMP